MRVVTATAVPVESALQPLLCGADFADAYQATLHDSALHPAEIFLRATRATPVWVTFLMSLRNRLVRLAGLKDVGDMRGNRVADVSLLRVGDRFGIFSVVGQSETELLLGIDDRHLDVRVSVLKRVDAVTSSYAVSTVVRIHNMLGHVYMAPVRHIHPRVVRALMRRADV